MSFWANKLGQQQPQPASATPPGQWWATPRAPQEQTTQPAAVGRVTHQQSPPNEYGGGTSETSMEVMLTNQNYVPGAKVMSAKDNDFCPNCGSGNYIQPTRNSMKKCFECGHNDRFEQTMSGVSAGQGIKVTGEVRAARVQGSVPGAPPMGSIIR